MLAENELVASSIKGSTDSCCTRGRSQSYLLLNFSVRERHDFYPVSPLPSLSETLTGPMGFAANETRSYAESENTEAFT